MIPSGPFVMFANCSIVYSGRASSTLEQGNYLILYKGDGSLMVHAGDQIQARNYQGAGSRLSVHGNKIVSVNKKELLTVEVYQVHWCNTVGIWSTSETLMRRTERELVQKIAAHSEQYLGVPLAAIKLEYPTGVGPIDILTETPAPDGKNYQIVEVKRKRITINDIVQLEKYVDHFISQGLNPHAIIAGPAISSKAAQYCEERKIEWLNVDFDDG